MSPCILRSINMKLLQLFIISLFTLSSMAVSSQAETNFRPLDDRSLIKAYSENYADLPKETLIAMIRDDALDSQKTAAAVRLFSEKYSHLVFSREKKRIERWLLIRRARTDSVFVEIEILNALCRLDRYKYFNLTTVELLKRLDHYNDSANQLAFQYLQEITQAEPGRAREARVIFNFLRKRLFLIRNELRKIDQPDSRLKQKITLLRWSVKILGTEELRRLPPEVLHLF